MNKRGTAAVNKAIQNNGLTEMRELYVYNLVINQMTQAEAAEAAGFSHPGVAANMLMKIPAVQEAIRRARMAAVDGVLAGVAFKTLEEVMRDADAPASARVAAATKVLTIGGYMDRGKALGKQGDKQVKPIGEMTPAELRAEIDGMRDQLDKAEDTIDDMAAEQAQPIELIE